MSDRPTDRASLVTRGLINLQEQIKSTQHYLATMHTLVARYEQGPPFEQAQVPGFKERITNLEDVLRVLAIFLELGKQEQQRLAGYLRLFERANTE